ncbi:hypothetical protein ZWY2020_021796 [Hordeum vulgare]|nr:hypothetical protein ZWY2020_021796 [Hordeum vulgare]
MGSLAGGVVARRRRFLCLHGFRTSGIGLDSAAIAVTDRVVLLGTHDGTLHILDFQGNQTEALKEDITQVVTDAKEKIKKFTETVELQIGLKNYDPQKDKHFSGSVKLPHIPLPKMRVCMLGDAQHVGEVWNIGELRGCSSERN